MKALKDCRYSAFISYAHADDSAWFGWVRQFRDELERSLDAMLRGVKLPRVHLSGENGPVAGVLSDQLKERVAQAFAMVIVVHDNYAQSSWCLKELEYFKELWGDQGFRERLYIVALSESAMNSVASGPVWKQVMPHDDQLWLPFFDAADHNRPVDVYMAAGLVSPAFRGPFERLRSDFASKLRAAAAAEVSVRDAPKLPPAGVQRAPRSAPGEDRAAVPSTPEVAELLPAVSPQLGAVALCFAPRPSEGRLAQCRQALQAAGVQLRSIPQDAVYGGFDEFESIEHLVLPFDDNPPLMPMVGPGGHLQMLRDAWLHKGHAADTLHWLDLRETSGSLSSPAGAAAYVASLGVPTVSVQALLQAWQPAPSALGANVQAVRIYIESNRHERNLWEPLGEQIRRRWQTLCEELAPGRVPPLSLRARGLPVEEIDRFPSLDDADGVVLLWGRKTSESLVAQIDKVEGKLSNGVPVPPGIVAYLMPPQTASEPMPAWGWQVLRFDAADEDNIDVVAEERDQLTRFLRKVFERRRLRDGGDP